MPWFVGLPLFLDAAGRGKAADPFAIRPLLAWMYATASSIVRCSMWSMRELIAWIASFATSGFLFRKFCAAMGFSEKKIGTNPEAKEPSKKSAFRGKDPRSTEVLLVDVAGGGGQALDLETRRLLLVHGDRPAQARTRGAGVSSG